MFGNTANPHLFILSRRARKERMFTDRKRKKKFFFNIFLFLSLKLLELQAEYHKHSHEFLDKNINELKENHRPTG